MWIAQIPRPILSGLIALAGQNPRPILRGPIALVGQIPSFRVVLRMPLLGYQNLGGVGLVSGDRLGKW